MTKLGIRVVSWARTAVATGATVVASTTDGALKMDGG
jgi:hypothetical protein